MAKKKSEEAKRFNDVETKSCKQDKAGTKKTTGKSEASVVKREVVPEAVSSLASGEHCSRVFCHFCVHSCVHSEHMLVFAVNTCLRSRTQPLRSRCPAFTRTGN